jgi:glycosyltransferase involved in cell wall biosynthesis
VRLALVNITGGGLSGGYRKYLRRLAPLLRDHPSVDGFENFVPESVGSEFAHSESPPESYYTQNDARRGFPQLRAAVRAFGASAVFIPTARWVDFGDVPTVVMVRNMEPLVLPFSGNSVLEGGKNLARAWAAQRACKRANRIVAVSSYVKSFLEQKWAIPTEKVDVVYHGVDSPAEEMTCPPQLASNDSPFLFTAGSIRPARGLEDILRAVSHLKNDGVDFQLVVAGDTRGAYFNAHYRKMMSLADRLSVASRVLWAGQLDPKQMAWCYHHARIFVMTSRVEACPNTSLEAMSHGCLCISTDSPPMPEFFEKAAIYYSAGDARGLADRIRALLATPKVETEQLSAAAATLARDYRWESTAAATIDVISRAAVN